MSRTAAAQAGQVDSKRLSSGGPRLAPVARLVLHVLALAAMLGAVVPILMTRPLDYRRQISPDSYEYSDAALQLVSGNGYVTFYHKGEARPPRYPPGYSIALTPFVAVGPFPRSAQTGAVVYTALYVAVAIWVAWVLGGPLAAILTSALIASSPWSRAEARLIMSDALSAALTIALVGVLHRVSGTRAVILGVLAGAGGIVRLPAFINVAAVFLALPRRPRIRFIIATLPFIAALGLFNWLTFGSPLRTGYDYWLPEIQSFDLANAAGMDEESNLVAPPDEIASLLIAIGRAIWPLCACSLGPAVPITPNGLYYPALLLGLSWQFVPPLSTVPGLVYVWRHRRAPGASFALWLVLGSIALFSVYWGHNARFMVAPATILAIYSTVAAARWIERLGWFRRLTAGGEAGGTTFA